MAWYVSTGLPGWSAGWAFLSLPALCSAAFPRHGGIAAALAVWVTLGLRAGFTPAPAVPWLVAYLLLGLCSEMLGRMGARMGEQARVTERQLYRQSRQLQVLSEISVALQSTTDLDRVIHIILSAITAGYGLCFNRALLFLIPEGERVLRGEVGIGSMTEQEGLLKWQRAVKNRLVLSDFIANREEVLVQDGSLNRVLRALAIPLDGPEHVLSRALTQARPQRVLAPDPVDPLQMLLAEQFHMESFAVVPMVHQGRQVGVIVVDNNINHQPIETDELGGVMQLATQAAAAIRGAQLFAETHRLAVTDGLTGLYNQRYFQEHYELHVAMAARGEEQLCLVLADIDYFKVYNDSHGHLEGNQVLHTLGRLMADLVQPGQVACRFGGEEFALVLPGVDLAEGVALAECIRSAVMAAPFRHGAAQPGGRLTISLGVAIWQPGMGPQELLNAADAAMYAAKRGGRNQVRVHEGALA